MNSHGTNAAVVTTRDDAIVIPFPRRPPAVVANTAVPQELLDGQERLAKALLSLDESAREQREALAKWRLSLAELKSSVGRLGKSMQDYNGKLATIDDGLKVAKKTSLSTIKILDDAGY
jgi:hypothetical protein